MTSISASNWKPFSKNTLKGFVDLELPSGMILRGATLHEKDGRRWVGLPAKPYTKQDGTQDWANIVEFTDKAVARKFNEQAVAAVLSIIEQ